MAYIECCKCHSVSYIIDYDEAHESVEIESYGSRESIKYIFHCEKCDLYTIAVENGKELRFHTKKVLRIDPEEEDFLIVWKADRKTQGFDY